VLLKTVYWNLIGGSINFGHVTPIYDLMHQSGSKSLGV